MRPPGWMGEFIRQGNPRLLLASTMSEHRTMFVDKTLARAAVIAVSDQVLQSAANFAASVFLIRFVSKADFGIYGVAYTTILLLNSGVTAIFATQMTYVVPHRAVVARKPFCSSLLLAQALMSAALAVIVVAGSLGCWISGALDAREAELGCVVGIGTAFLNRQEYYRSLAYLFDRPRLAMIYSSVQVAVWATLVAGGWSLGFKNLEFIVLAGWCLGAVASNLVARTLFPLPPSGGWRAARDATAEVWGQGMWAALGVLMTWIQNQSYAWLLVLLAGPESTAEANFAKLFFSPLALVLMALNRVARPGLATIFAREGKRRTVLQGRRLLIGVITLVLVYIILALSSERWVIANFASKAYADAGGMLVIWGIVTAIQVTRWNSTLLLGVFRRHRQMTSVEAFAAAAGFGASWALVVAYAAPGAVAGIGVGEVVLTALMWREVSRAVAAGDAPETPISHAPRTSGKA